MNIRETTIIALQTRFPAQPLRTEIALAPRAQRTAEQDIERAPPAAALHEREAVHARLELETR